MSMQAVLVLARACDPCIDSMVSVSMPCNVVLTCMYCTKHHAVVALCCCNAGLQALYNIYHHIMYAQARMVRLQALCGAALDAGRVGICQIVDRHTGRVCGCWHHLDHHLRLVVGRQVSIGRTACPPLLLPSRDLGVQRAAYVLHGLNVWHLHDVGPR